MVQMTKFSKTRKIAHYWALFAQIWEKMNFPQKWALSLFSIYSHLTSSKKSEKNDERRINKRMNTGEIKGPARSNQ